MNNFHHLSSFQSKGICGRAEQLHRSKPGNDLSRKEIEKEESIRDTNGHREGRNGASGTY